MCCKNRKYIARTANTLLLAMGGFSFGHDVGDRLLVNPVYMGFAIAFLFFLFSVWMRRACRCKHDTY